MHSWEQRGFFRRMALSGILALGSCYAKTDGL